ncbi:MAG TPA: sugar kinase [Anaerovoracaceae bacterium]|nr:sugar kinase [Anaerovoracaceae bacterium]
MNRKKVVGFGEIMLRLSPLGYMRLIQAEGFTANYTGAEANSCVSLSMMGFNSEFVTKVPDNEIGQCAAATMQKYGVGIGNIVLGGERLGLYYSEKGAAQRPSKVIYDRKYSAISQAKRDEFDWDRILDGADAFLFTGITAALGEELPGICMDACQTARKKNITVFCDLNYRNKLWTTEQAFKVMDGLMPYVNVLMGNEEDSEKVLGIKSDMSDVTHGRLCRESYSEVAEKIVSRYGTDTVAFTLRTSISASDNKWAAMLYKNGSTSFSREYDMHIVDRMGGGDSFGAGLIYGLLSGMSDREALEFAAAASCLKHSIEQDFNLSTADEIKALMNGDSSGRIQR